MANPLAPDAQPNEPPGPVHNEGGKVRAEDEATVGAPRWVKVLGIIALVAVVLVVVLVLVGGGPGGHGPGRHTLSSAAPGGAALLATAR